MFIYSCVYQLTFSGQQPAYRPTRITSSSATLIDNIFMNDSSFISSGLLCTEISDHLPIF